MPADDIPDDDLILMDPVGRYVPDRARDAFIAIDQEGIIVSWNAKTETMFGWSRVEAIGKRLVQLIDRPASLEGLIRLGEANVLKRETCSPQEASSATAVVRCLELASIQLCGVLHRDGSVIQCEVALLQPIPRGDGFLFGAFLGEYDLETRRMLEVAKRQPRRRQPGSATS